MIAGKRPALSGLRCSRLAYRIFIKHALPVLVWYAPRTSGSSSTLRAVIASSFIAVGFLRPNQAVSVEQGVPPSEQKQLGLVKPNGILYNSAQNKFRGKSIMQVRT